MDTFNINLFPEQVFIPERLSYWETIAKNPIKQLEFVGFTETLGVEPYSKRGLNGWILNSNKAGRILAVPQMTSASPCSSILLLQGINCLPRLRSEVVSWKWIRPKPATSSNGFSKNFSIEARESWESSFIFAEEQRIDSEIIQPGLRPPQLGALYAALAHWTVSDDIANIVMPTGTGKTETMLALLLKQRPSCLLVIVPNAALREQTARKFLTLGILPEFGITTSGVKFPVVGEINHQFNDPMDVQLFFHRCNVVISTMAVLGECSDDVLNMIVEMCSHVFIDEAHHVMANTWNSFREKVTEAHKPILQFTATPFRNDGKHIGGRSIFTYPLKKAQEEAYFTPITFLSIWEYNRELADIAIARRAILKLEDDLNSGFDHILMARTNTIERAKEVYEIYKDIAPTMNPIIVHSKQSQTEQSELIKKIRTRQSKVIVCVNMFGEGFDLPQLKIAAIHDVHKSLAVTIQFIGRFTRSAHSIGSATVIANAADAEVEEALEDLYSKDADWNVVLRHLSEGATNRQKEQSTFLEGFQQQPNSIPLQIIFPKMSFVAYKTTCDDWNPGAVVKSLENTDLLVRPTLNPIERVLLFVTREETPVVWGTARSVSDIVHHLYLFHWDEKQNLLFINSTNNRTVHSDFARLLTGEDTEIIRGEKVYRSLYGINRFILSNLGLLHLLSRATQFTMHVGSDVKQGLSQASTINRKKSNLFGHGYENGECITLGASHKGRIWSHKMGEDISEWVNWCRYVGTKLLNDNISTETILQQVIIPEKITSRPLLIPIAIQWPMYFLERNEESVFIEINKKTVPFYLAQLEITSFNTSDPIRFRVIVENEQAEYQLNFDENRVSYRPISETIAYITASGSREPLSEWFEEESPIITFEDTSTLEYNEINRSKTCWEPYNPTKIKLWNWNNVNLSAESRYKKLAQPTRLKFQPNSIQDFVITHMLSNDTIGYDIIFDDDGTGEIADLVGISASEEYLDVHFFHCKYSKGPVTGVRVDDFYEVCGQAVKSVHWRSNVADIFARLKRREEDRLATYHITRFIKGNLEKLEEVRRRSRKLIPIFHIFIVQPGLCGRKIEGPILDLLGATELYLNETFSVPLTVIANED